MKINPNIALMRRNHQSGTTLIELSVVVAVLFLLVGVLFIGISAWQAGANKAVDVVAESTIQKAVRGYQNMSNPGLNVGDPVAIADLVTAGYFAAPPVQAEDGLPFTYTGTVPAQGVAYATDTTTPANNPTPDVVAGW